MPFRAKPLAIATILALAAAACGSGAAPATSPTVDGPATSTAATTPSDAVPAVPEVLDFEAPLVGGGTFRGETLAGRDVAFWFWAPW